jgi:hypothetical protein
LTGASRPAGKTPVTLLCDPGRRLRRLTGKPPREDELVGRSGGGGRRDPEGPRGGHRGEGRGAEGREDRGGGRPGGENRERVDARLDRMDDRLDRMEERLERMAERLERR